MDDITSWTNYRSKIILDIVKTPQKDGKISELKTTDLCSKKGLETELNIRAQKFVTLQKDGKFN